MTINNLTFDNVQKSVPITLCSYPIKKSPETNPGRSHKSSGNWWKFLEKTLDKHIQAGGSRCCEEQPKGKAGSPGEAAACTPVKPAVELAVGLLRHSASPHLWLPGR